MLQPNKILPLFNKHWSTIRGRELPVPALPGLKRRAAGNHATTQRLSLTSAADLLRYASGLDGTPLGPIDVTGVWHGPETLSVFQPCITLAVDAEGWRWIAETSGTRLPGPVWCVSTSPQVALYISADLEEFLSTLHRHLHLETFDFWMSRLVELAHQCWQQRGALAYQARQPAAEDGSIRTWLLQLPRDARIYDLRAPVFGLGFPYGAAGEVHRCGGLPLFAISGFPAPSRWSNYLADLAFRTEIPRPRSMRPHHEPVHRLSAVREEGARPCA